MIQQLRKATARSVLLLCLLLGVACRPSVEKPETFAVNVRLAAKPDKLSPLLSLNGYAIQVQEQLFMSLQQYHPGTLELEPYLAKEAPTFYPISEGLYRGGVAYQFELREEARWDNGESVGASDYVFTLKAMLNPRVAAAPYRSFFDFLGDVEIDPENPRRFTVFTNKTYMLAEAALSSIAIYPEYRYDPDGLLRSFSISDFQDSSQSGNQKKFTAQQEERLQSFADQFHSPLHSTDPAGVGGCGPYQLVEWQSGHQIILAKKTNWWGDSLSEKHPSLAAFPDEIRYKIIPDNAAAITALKDGQLEVMSEINPLTFVEMQAAAKNRKDDYLSQHFNFYTPSYLAYYYIGINGKLPALRQIEVRRALAHLTDAEEAIKSLLYDLGERVTGPVHPSKSFYNDQLAPIPYDLAKAQQLLSQTGWSDTDNNGILDKMIDSKKEELQLRFLFSASNEMGKGMGLLLRQAAAKAGIDIELQGLEFREAIRRYRSRDYDLAFFRWSKLPGPDDLKQVWHTSSDTPAGGNRTGFGDSHSDALIDSIRICLDANKRKDLYLRIQKRIYDDQPYIFLFAPLERIAIDKRFEATVSARRPGFLVRQFKLKDTQ